ncbi:hypothetical protein N7535_008476 [Penicillium sp. DV-2018c]|nr:hypothetical protein N7461_002234 [Penicillium sp. DV-2018c]KAJ5563312.1 hypothetical protein N7535_008476 [Penicillium sp. DV-2018c]
MASDDEDYYLPPEQVRPFTSGVRRKRVQFVRSSDLDTTTTATPSETTTTNTKYQYSTKYTNPSTAIAITTTNPPTIRATSRYQPRNRNHPTTRTLLLLLEDMRNLQSPPRPNANHPKHRLTNKSKSKSKSKSTQTQTPPSPRSIPSPPTLPNPLPPPSHLDRTRAGLRYLSTYGWDPDSRLGLGAAGREGIREPIKPRVKHDTAGLGTGLDEDGDRVRSDRIPVPAKVQKKKQLNAKQVRKSVIEERRRAERLRRVFLRMMRF